MSLRKYPGISIPDIPNKGVRDRFQTLDIFLKDLEAAVVALQIEIDLPTPAGSAPRDAEYVVTNLDATLPNERRLVGTSPVTITDNGAGVSVAVGLNLALLGGLPTNVYATVGVAGSASTYVATDATLPYPDGIMSSVSSTLKLTDAGGHQTVTGDLGGLNFISADDDFFFGTAATGIDAPGHGHLGIGSGALSTNSLFVSTSTTATAPGAASLNFLIVPTQIHATLGATGVFGTAFNITGADQIMTAGQFTFLLGGSGTTVTKKQTAFQFLANFQAGTSNYDDVAILRDQTAGHATSTRTVTRFASIDFGFSQGAAFDTAGITVPTLYGLLLGDRAEISSSNAREEDVLTLNQLAVDAGDDGAHIKFNDKTTDPTALSDGQLWYRLGQLNFRDGGATTNLLAGGGGDVTIRKNSGADVGQRPRLNFIEGTDITLTIVDDVGDDEVDITVTSTAAGAAADQAKYIKAFIPNAGSLTVPDKNQIVVCDNYAIEGDADLILEGEDSLLCILQVAA